MLCVTDLAQANCLFNMVIKFPEVLSAGTFYPQCTNEKSKKQTTCPVLNISQDLDFKYYYYEKDKLGEYFCSLLFCNESSSYKTVA